MPTKLEDLQLAVSNALDYREYERLIDYYYDAEIQPRLQNALEEIVPLIKARHTLDTTSEKDMVRCVHYTSIFRLFNMLDIENEHLKLHDSVHLNDPDEGNYLLRNLDRCGKYDRIMPVIVPHQETQELNSAYLMSFVVAKNEDDIDDKLVFWRTYGNEGKGCAITFSIESKYLRKVLYGNDIDDTFNLLEPVLNAMSPLFGEHFATDQIIQAKVRNVIATSLKAVLYLYKSSAYEYENEARIVFLESEVKEDQILYDYQEDSAGRPKIRHYIYFDRVNLKKLLPSGSTFTVGPTVPHANNVCKYIEKMMKKMKLSGITVRVSQIPYRLT